MKVAAQEEVEEVEWVRARIEHAVRAVLYSVYVEREVDATALCATESDVESNSITLLRPDGMHEQHARHASHDTRRDSVHVARYNRVCLES